MVEKHKEESGSKGKMFKEAEEMARGWIQEFIEELLEEEITELLTRGKGCERRIQQRN